MKDVQQIIQIDGEIWQNQINSIGNTVPPNAMHLDCVGNIHDRLRMRPHGYIVLAEDGIMIDELFAISYDVYVIHRVDLMYNTSHIGHILRLTLATRLSLEKELDKGTQILFEVYLFMPLHMQTQELANIRQNILANSHKHLTASGFYENSVINQK
ncbi:unnamed protein product [Adineta steineri]|uniref:Uncharacterized protein n=1 Tax=Adineta steineri TaxID=433720 RepID=A0A815CRT2_9BILA|nr:unnamed protein product [Adineta steineri]CAF1287358.1 unnamed protein product [Adineta steineri]